MRAILGRLPLSRRLGRRFLVTGVDQCVASLSNFAVGVVIARVAGLAALGAYSLAYVIWLALADVHRSLVTDPMAIENDLNGVAMARNIQAGLAAEIALGVAITAPVAFIGLVLIACGQHAYGVAFVALAPWVTFLLVQDYWRWVGFMRSAPTKALANDLAFDAVQAVALGWLLASGLHSSVLAIAGWGMGALAASGFGLWQHRVRPQFRVRIARLKERWPLGRMLLGGAITNWGASQSYVVLTGALLGPAGVGALRAAQSLVNGPSLVLLQAGGSIGLPEACKALEAEGWPGLRRVGRAVTAAGVVGVGTVGLVVLLFGRQLLVLLYGPQLGRYAGTADLLAVSVLVSTSSLGAVLCLKATKQLREVFGRSLLSLCVSVVAVLVMVPFFGLNGAAGAAVARTFVTSYTMLRLHHRRSRRFAERMYWQLRGLPGPVALGPVTAAVPPVAALGDGRDGNRPGWLLPATVGEAKPPDRRLSAMDEAGTPAPGISLESPRSYSV